MPAQGTDIAHLAMEVLDLVFTDLKKNGTKAMTKGKGHPLSTYNTALFITHTSLGIWKRLASH